MLTEINNPPLFDEDSRRPMGTFYGRRKQGTQEMKNTKYAVGVVLGMLAGAVQAQSVDVPAAEALLKKSGCMKCHSVSAEKEGPAFKKTAAKYKGQADAAAKLQTHLMSGPTIKVDGKEERHDIIKSKDDREIKNAVAYILSR
jgi:cytochrome c